MHIKAIFISWNESSSRASSLAKVLNARPFFIGKSRQYKNKIRSFLTYIPKTIKNIKIAFKYKPEVLIITNTQWIIAFVNLIIGRLLKSKVVFDSHSCAFNNNLLTYPIFLSKIFAKKAHLSIVTNKANKIVVESWKGNAFILTDIPYESEMLTSTRLDLGGNFNICFVCSFSHDEPFREVFHAANNLKNISIIVTGNYQKVITGEPEYKNITLTGFLPDEDYKALLNSSDAILCLDRRENTMQRGGSEAVSVGKPLITSNTQMLRHYFKRGTIFVDPNSQSIKRGIENMKSEYKFYLKEMREFRSERADKFNKILQDLKDSLELI